MELITGLTLFLGLAGLASSLAGALFIVSPETLSQLSQKVTRSIVTLDSFMLKHNAIAGIFMLMGGLVMIYSFTILIGAAPAPF
ncbi:MAG: hypothetical protein HYY54_03650 [candidate division NC10 bacterium]|nr:hypothetical protein [candidate division NC10 bacterium]MBI3002711.1 hypothetical protein [candidate division NC10 bacterium]